MKKVVIDTDPGTDDAIALMMALGSPHLDILGLITVGGNAPLAQTTRNALRILEYMDRTAIEVFRGSARPLRGRFHYAHYFHGPGGLTVRLPLPSTRPEPQRATEFIVEQARAFHGGFSAIALGPLTNLARAIEKDRRLIDRIDEIVVMGGAVEVPGNVTAHAEFNIYNDPAAAEIVFPVSPSSLWAWTYATGFLSGVETHGCAKARTPKAWAREFWTAGLRPTRTRTGTAFAILWRSSPPFGRSCSAFAGRP